MIHGLPAEKPAFNYCESLPENMHITALKSFAIGFIASTLLSGFNPIVGLIGGTLSALASLINGLITPLIEKLFEDCDSPILKIASKTIVSLSCLNLVLLAASPLIGTVIQINILAAIISTCLINILFYVFSSNNPENREAPPALLLI